ncbi:hypothetical protein Tco_0169313 [Tanacetum coccineum]
MLGSMNPELHRLFKNSLPYDMIQELKSIFEKQAEVKGYVEQLERLGYVIPQDISVGLILNGLISDFAGFVRNYIMHNMGKTIGELHALLIEYEKGLPKKDATPQVLAIQGERATDLLELIDTNICGPLRHVSRQGASYFITFTDDFSHYGYVYLLKPKHEDYALDSTTRILNMVPPKKKKLISQESSGRAVELEEIQDEDTSPSKKTSEIPTEVKGFEPPQEELAPIRRSVRIHRAPERLCLNVEVEERSLGGLNDYNYKAALFDSEFYKWLNFMNTKMQSMKDNQVWRLVDLPPKRKTVRSVGPYKQDLNEP